MEEDSEKWALVFLAMGVGGGIGVFFQVSFSPIYYKKTSLVPRSSCFFLEGGGGFSIDFLIY